MRLGAVPRELFLANSSAPSRSLEWPSWPPRWTPSSPVGQLYKYDPMNCSHAKRRRAGLRIQDSTAAGSRIHSKDESQGICAAWAAMRQTPEGNWTAIIHRPPLEASEFTATASMVRLIRYYRTHLIIGGRFRATPSAADWQTARSGGYERIPAGARARSTAGEILRPAAPLRVAYSCARSRASGS